MKASSIALVHEMEGEELGRKQRFLVNLIDSPGHIDFSNEVSSAVRVSDGALVLVDAVEGVQVQTHTVLKQAWNEKVECILVINKMDKLFTDLRLNATEAYVCVTRIIEQVNAITSSFLVSEAMEKAAHEVAPASISSDNENAGDVVNVANYQVEIDDKEGMFFSPERGNVVFSSAFDSWGFTLVEFATFYAKKLGVRKEALIRCLWGDHFYQAKTRQVVRKPPSASANLSPMFVQFILEPIAQVYNEFLNNKSDALLFFI